LINENKSIDLIFCENSQMAAHIILYKVFLYFIVVKHNNKI